MTDEYIKKKMVLELIERYSYICSEPPMDKEDRIKLELCHSFLKKIETITAADVVSRDEYNHLLEIASKMHTWIFLHSFDEQAIYDELGLTDKDNVLLGYGGQVIFEERAENNG